MVADTTGRWAGRTRHCDEGCGLLPAVARYRGPGHGGTRRSLRIFFLFKLSVSLFCLDRRSRCPLSVGRPAPSTHSPMRVLSTPPRRLRLFVGPSWFGPIDVRPGLLEALPHGASRVRL